MQIKNILIGIAIFILTLFVVIYGIHTFYEKPTYEDFCIDRYYEQPMSKPEVCPEVCIALYEIKGNECILNECGSGCGPDEFYTFSTIEKCKEELENRNCYKNFDKANEKYRKIIFVVSIFIGLALITVGFLLFKLDHVGAGLMAGGIGTFIYGAGGYWRYTENWIKFIISLAGLSFLIWFAYKINKKE